MYTLAVDGYAPKFLGALNRARVPWVGVLVTSSISALCFGASYIGTGQLWSWLQNIVGVSNQISWICIGLASLRFRSGIKAQGLEHLLPFKNWTYPWGPIFAVGLNSVLVLVQGWSSFSPNFQGVNFVSYYIEIPVMIVMFVGWKLVKRTKFVRVSEMDLTTDRAPYTRRAEGDGSDRDSTCEASAGGFKKVARSPWVRRVKKLGTSTFL